jgi:hypothetical protein
MRAVLEKWAPADGPKINQFLFFECFKFKFEIKPGSLF